MARPRLLDLFCCAGGAGMGYHLAGFDVVGVDSAPQPHYPFEFHQADAMTYPLEGFDAIHASPPCQHRSVVTPADRRPQHPNLLTPTLARFRAEATVPWVVENVPGVVPFGHDLELCGSMFGLPIRRHRWFVTTPPIVHLLPPCQHRRTDLAFSHKGERAYADAMGCHWMSKVEARQAIPPAYTEWIGRQILSQIT